jgi:hypothetical protein
MTSKAMEKWIAVEYELLSFELTDRFVAVFADLAEDGMTDLSDEPLQAIGLAKVTQRTVVGNRSKLEYDVQDVEVWNELVGLQLQDGFWQIANEYANFAGICEVGGDILNATGSLNRTEFKKLRPQPT